ncbi:hypothetical protein [Hoeflea sp. TYP-13]|uniref:hypothetical protein n=1 Tax=Hoeflea sp. TYP-13 TaxID=3230023 RepID=UPI0034C61ACA
MRSALLVVWLMVSTSGFAAIGHILLRQPLDVSAIPADSMQTQSLADDINAPASDHADLETLKFPATTERPLFSRGRRKFVPPPPPKPAKPRQTVTTNKPAPKVRTQAPNAPAPKLSLIGISISSGTASALLSSGKGENTWVLAGDSIGSWMVGEIDTNSVQLTSTGRSIRLQLYELEER